MNKQTKVTLTALALGVGISGAGMASAHRGFDADATPEERVARLQERFENKAEILGTDVETVKNAWAEGVRLPELAEQLGISEEELRARMQARHQDMAAERLAELVERGVITQEQADERLEIIQKRIESGEGKGFGKKGGRRGGERGPRGF